MLFQMVEKKDIEKYLLDENFHYTILRTKIDEYLDYFIMSDLSYSLKIHIIDIGRKKDLEKFKNSIFNQALIKSFTDDEILKLR